MDVAAVVCLCVLWVQHKHLIKSLGALRAIFEHGAHGGVAVDIGVFPLDVVFGSAFEGQVLIHLHQGGVHLPHTGALCAVEDIFFGSAGMSVFNQYLFHHVLNLLDSGQMRGRIFFLQTLLDLQSKAVSSLVILASHRGRCAKDRPCDFLHVIGGGPSVPFDDGVEHEHSPLRESFWSETIGKLVV